MGRRLPLATIILAGCLLAVAGCGSSRSGTGATTPPPSASPPPGPSGSADNASATPATSTPGPTTGASATSSPAGATLPTRPAWLGTRVLPTRIDGTAEPQETPPELADRRFATIDVLPPPADGRFHATVAAVPADVLARSTWEAGCPVTVDQLRYVTLGFWGFDDRPHTGELLVNASVADAIVTAFRALFEARYPIEEMRVTTRAERDAPPIGDGNDTGAFVCRPAVGSTRFSEHAYGLAVDINPFLNPYVKGDLVLPELARAYLRRTPARPGVIEPDGPVVRAFDAIGWGWGGRWSSLKDYQHFSLNNR